MDRLKINFDVYSLVLIYVCVYISLVGEMEKVI